MMSTHDETGIALEQQVATLRSSLAEHSMVLASIRAALDGEPLNDFQASIPLVRAVADLTRLRTMESQRASEADVLNQELRENYGSAHQVTLESDWRPAIRTLVDGVRYGERVSIAPCMRCGATESADGDWYRLCGACRWEAK